MTPMTSSPTIMGIPSQACPGRRIGIHFHLDGQHFISVRRQLQLVKQATKADKGTVHCFLIADLQVEGVAFGGERGLDGA